MGTKTVTRNELYKLVWSQPISKLAKEFGISDRGLGKVCERHQIPVPGRGYWARVRAGYKVPQIPLRNTKVNPEITIRSTDNKPVAITAGKSDLLLEAISLCIEPVRDRLSPSHEFIKTASKTLRKATKDDYGRVACRSICVNVGKGSVGRVLRLIDALARTMEKHGFPFAMADHYKGKRAGFDINGEKIWFEIFEPSKKLKRNLTKKQKLDIERDSWLRSRLEYEYVPTGNIKFTINNGWRSGIRDSWSDGKSKKLEDYMPDIVYSFILISDFFKEERFQDKERKRIEDLHRRAEEIRKQAIEDEKKRVNELIKDAENWRKANEIREYISAVKESAEMPKGGFPQELSQWVEWASKQADLLDPCKQVDN